jgi:hypothetical protein
VVAALALFFIARKMKEAYRQKVAMSEWQEGVIVFPSGDVVVRLEGLFGKIDTTIESVYLTKAEVTTACAFTRLRRLKFLTIHYISLDAKPTVIAVAEADLRESPATIAAYINDLKAKALTSF